MTPRRPGRHDAGAALARLGAQAVHLWPRLRGRRSIHPETPDRRSADALRQLCAGEFRSDLPGHRDGAQARCSCRSTCRRSRCSTRSGASRLTTRLAQAGTPLVLPKGEAPGLAMALGGVGVRLAELTALYAGIARLGTTVPLVERARRGGRGGAGAAHRSGCRLVRRQCADRHAAAGECRRRPHRLQDRHLLRLSRRLGGRLRRQAHDRRVGRPAGRRAGAGPGRSHGGGTDPVRCLRPHRTAVGAAAAGAEGRAARRRRRGCRRRCNASGPAAAGGGAQPAAHPVSAERRPARARQRRRQAGPVALKIGAASSR